MLPNHIIDLQPGWDGHQAPSPSADSLRIGRAVLELGLKHGLFEARMTPIIEGGIMVYFFGSGRRVAFWASNDGEMILSLADQSRPDIMVEEVLEDGLESAVMRIRSFISANL